MIKAGRAIGALFGVLATGCGAASSPGQVEPAASAASGAASSAGAITVFAAASLTGTVTDLARSFEAAGTGVRIRLNFGGSSSLASAIVSGAPADVFAAASTASMKQVTDHGAAAGAPVILARNVLQIATPRGNSQRIASLADVVRPGVALALCAPQVPCGAAAEKAFRAARLRARPVTLESDVKAVLTKVRLGEVDAGLVYRSDVLAASGQVTGVSFPQSAQAVASYPAVALRNSRNSRLAEAFVRHLQSAQAAAAFRAAGFLPP